MIDFSKRSAEKEMLDGENIPFVDIRRNMQELNIINSRLGGHSITISGIKKLIEANSSNKPISICEIGSGGGDNITAICDWAHKKGFAINCKGIDKNPSCIAFANEKKYKQPAEFIAADYREGLKGGDKPDIIFASLFCHHFSDGALINMIRWMKENSTLGFMINDLHRHPLAYYSIKILTGLFSSSYLVKNDAPLSVLRGFRKSELEKLLMESGINNYEIEWRWAFRYMVLARTDHIKRFS